jgi:cytoskeletal protein CcmA (bactofilin family)
VIIGKSGTLIGSIIGFSAVLVEGKVLGNIAVDTLILEPTASVHGNITCKSVEIEEGASLYGRLKVSKDYTELSTVGPIEVG